MCLDWNAVDFLEPGNAPVVHRLERDQRQVPVDGRLGHLRVLDAVRPAPQGLAFAQFADVFEHRLGQQDDVAGGEEVRPREHPGDERGQLAVGDSEVFAVAVLQVDAGTQIGVDALEVRGVDGQPVLVLLAGVRDDAEVRGGATMPHRSWRSPHFVDRLEHEQDRIAMLTVEALEAIASCGATTTLTGDQDAEQMASLCGSSAGRPSAVSLLRALIPRAFITVPRAKGCLGAISALRRLSKRFKSSPPRCPELRSSRG